MTTGNTDKKIWVVAKDGSGDFKTLGEALAAKDADNILVKAGVYNEKLSIDRPMTITGEDGVIIEPPKIDVDSEDYSLLDICENSKIPFINVNAQDVTLENLECKGVDGCVKCDTCIYICPAGERCRILNCKVSDFPFGIVCNAPGHLFVDNCEIFNNKRAGIIIAGSLRVKSEWKSFTISRSQIHDNSGCGIEVPNTASPNCISGKIEDCRIFSNKYEGIRAEEIKNFTISDSEIHDNGSSGIKITHCPNVKISHCKVTDNSTRESWGRFCAAYLACDYQYSAYSYCSDSLIRSMATRLNSLEYLKDCVYLTLDELDEDDFEKQRDLSANIVNETEIFSEFADSYRGGAIYLGAEIRIDHSPSVNISQCVISGDGLGVRISNAIETFLDHCTISGCSTIKRQDEFDKLSEQRPIFYFFEPLLSNSAIDIDSDKVDITHCNIDKVSHWNSDVSCGIRIWSCRKLSINSCTFSNIQGKLIDIIDRFCDRSIINCKKKNCKKKNWITENWTEENWWIEDTDDTWDDL